MPKPSKRNQILQTALELFARHGYKGTSINMITTEIGVSQGLLYNFFDSKEDLLKEIMNLALDDVQKSLVPYNIQSDPGNALKEHVRATCKIIKLRSDFWRLIHAVRLQEGLPGVLMESYRSMVKQVTAIFGEVFTKLGYDHPHLEALLFLSQIDGLVIMYLQDDRIPIDRLADQLIKRYKS